MILVGRGGLKMKIAILGDINANLPALEAVLAHAKKLGVDEIWGTGNLLGYGGFPNEVAQLFRQEKIKAIAGPLDRLIVKAGSKRKIIKKSKNPDQWLHLYWLCEALSDQNYKYIRSLENELWFKIENKSFRLTGDQIENKDKLYGTDPVKSGSGLIKVLGTDDVMIYNYLPQPKALKFQGKLFINAGSLGNFYDGHPSADYSVISVQDEKLHFHHYQVKYVQKTVKPFQIDLPAEFLTQIQPYTLPQTMQEIAVSQEAEILAEGQPADNTLSDVTKLAQLFKYPVEHSKQSKI